MYAFKYPKTVPREVGQNRKTPQEKSLPPLLPRPSGPSRLIALRKTNGSDTYIEEFHRYCKKRSYFIQNKEEMINESIIKFDGLDFFLNATIWESLKII